MKLIIDISEDDYALCKLANEATSIRLKVSDNLRFAIANGTPLDEIRAEIIEKLTDKEYLKSICPFGNYGEWYDAMEVDAVAVVNEIIDKYRGGR